MTPSNYPLTNSVITVSQMNRIPSDIRISWTTDSNFTMLSGIPDPTDLLEPSYVYGIKFEVESLNMAADRAWDDITNISEEHCGGCWRRPGIILMHA